MKTRFLPAYTLVRAPSASGSLAPPGSLSLVLHGFLGKGLNLAAFARRLATAHPSGAYILVDLRLHGRSQAAPPPHTLEAAAEDLIHLVEDLRLPVIQVVGHSFGGKVALSYLARAPKPPQDVWILDAAPGPSPEGSEVRSADPAADAGGVLRTLLRLQESAPFASRERFIDLVIEAGYAAPIAEWLATNLRRGDDGFRLDLDLNALRDLLADAARTDLWPVLENPPVPTRVHVVVGGRSNVLGVADRARLVDIASRSAQVSAHVLEHAGHWLHTDAIEDLLQVMTARGPEPAAH